MFANLLFALVLQSAPSTPACQDIHYAMENFSVCETACADEDDGVICHRVASLARDGFRDETGTPDYELAAALFQRACGLGFAFGCHDLALIHWEGPQEYLDDRAGFDLFEQACTEHDLKAACGMLGTAYYLGRGTEPDQDRALALWESSCAPGWTTVSACRQLGTVHLLEEIPSARPLYGMEMLEQACADGDAISCAIAARSYIVHPTIPENIPRTIALTGQACELGLPPEMSSRCSPAFRAALERMAEMSPNRPSTPK